MNIQDRVLQEAEAFRTEIFDIDVTPILGTRWGSSHKPLYRGDSPRFTAYRREHERQLDLLAARIILLACYTRCEKEERPLSRVAAPVHDSLDSDILDASHGVCLGDPAFDFLLDGLDHLVESRAAYTELSHIDALRKTCDLEVATHEGTASEEDWDEWKSGCWFEGYFAERVSAGLIGWAAIEKAENVIGCFDLLDVAKTVAGVGVSWEETHGDVAGASINRSALRDRRTKQDAAKLAPRLEEFDRLIDECGGDVVQALKKLPYITHTQFPALAPEDEETLSRDSIRRWIFENHPKVIEHKKNKSRKKAA